MGFLDELSKKVLWSIYEVYLRVFTIPPLSGSRKRIVACWSKRISHWAIYSLMGKWTGGRVTRVGKNRMGCLERNLSWFNLPTGAKHWRKSRVSGSDGSRKRQSSTWNAGSLRRKSKQQNDERFRYRLRCNPRLRWSQGPEGGRRTALIPSSFILSFFAWSITWTNHRTNRTSKQQTLSPRDTPCARSPCWFGFVYSFFSFLFLSLVAPFLPFCPRVRVYYSYVPRLRSWWYLVASDTGWYTYHRSL